MRSLFLVVTVFLWAAACSEQGNYLVKVPPPEEAIQEKTDDPQALIFSPKVDVLFIVDDSYSMDTHQRNLSGNIDLFVGEIGKEQFLDYHIGVVTTSTRDVRDAGRLVGSPNFVTRNTPDALNILRENIMVGLMGDAVERSFEPFVAALSSPKVDVENKGFYRKDAHLAIVFITDAEDQSDRPTEYYTDFLQVLKGGDKEKIITYGVIIPSGVTNCTRDGYGNPARLEEFIDFFNGIKFSLCDPDFGVKLANLGKDLAERVGAVIPLNQLPDERTIRVNYGTQIIPRDPLVGWQYVPSKVGLVLGAELVLDPNQPSGTQLEVQFVPADKPEKGI